MTPALCAECGEPLPPTKPGQRRLYCPPPRKCKSEHWNRVRPRNPKPTACLHCGEPVKPRKGGGVYRRYCDRRCAARAGYDRRSGERKHKACAHCGRPLTSGRRDRRHCDHHCRSAARRAKARQPPPPTLAELRVLRVGWPGAKRAA
jgi:hypothetical protein